MIKISVIIPNYNQSHYVANAIHSVLAQHYPHYEIIVVDDGSTDDSREVVAQFGDSVRYIEQTNQGLAGARNTGIQAAAGELIGLLDADDEWCPEYLAEMVGLFEKNPDAGVFYCMARCMDMDGHDLPQVIGGPPVNPSLLYQQLLRANFIIPSTVTFRRTPVMEAGCFDANLRSCEDWDLWLRLLPTEKIVGVNRSLVRYRIHGSSLSTNVDGMHTAAKKVIEKHFGPDDGQLSAWSLEKRRAYGGLYRYYLLTSVQRQNNWQIGSFYLKKALEIDPTLARDLDLFYQLALGEQPNGYRDTAQHLDLHQNASNIQRLLNDVFSKELPPCVDSVRRPAYGTANYAIGLVAYNTNQRDLSKRFILRALASSPKLLLDRKVVFTLIKSYIPPSLINRFKRH